MNKIVYENIQKLLPEVEIKFQEPMHLHTTFRVGGCADAFIEIQEEGQLQRLIPYLKMVEADFFVLGNGSNLLVSDHGYQGIILHIGSKMSGISVKGNTLFVGAGVALNKVASIAMEKGLAGMEFAAGIPGSVGGAVVMNAGAYEGEMKQIVTKVRVMNANGDILELDNSSMEFGYRTSAIKYRDFIVLEVVLQLQEGKTETIKAMMDDFACRRKEKQPLNYPSAGSTFKRPDGHYAGKLIMDAGLRGFRIGGAQVSEKHCGFVINSGNATAQDIWELMEEVREKVYEQFEIRLEPEIIKIGDF